VQIKISKTIQHSINLKAIKMQYIYSPIEGSEVVIVFERNNAGLKKPSSFD
jgi:hypothetical protein